MFGAVRGVVFVFSTALSYRLLSVLLWFLGGGFLFVKTYKKNPPTLWLEGFSV